jgi:putative ABC transport system ATP-binding protein
VIVCSCSHVSHEFVDAGTRVMALDDVSLDVRAGELVLVVGPSGSGKSTLLSVLAGLLTPTRGEATLGGDPLSPLTVEGRALVRRKHAGFVFQSFHLFAALTARANVECVLAMQGLSRAEQVVVAERALARVGLSARTSHKPGQLSGGERQRVALARALATEPRIIFGDEPTSSLDPRSAAVVLDRLRECVDDSRSVVLATHDARLFSMATRIVRLEGGRVVEDVAT